MQSDEDALMVSASSVTLIAASLAIRIGTGAYLVMQDGMTLIFDTQKAAAEMDTRYCYNAVARDAKTLSVLDSYMRSKKPISLRVHTIKNYFDAGASPYNELVHYKYNGRPIQNYCDRKDLKIISRRHSILR